MIHKQKPYSLKSQTIRRDSRFCPVSRRSPNGVFSMTFRVITEAPQSYDNNANKQNAVEDDGNGIHDSSSYRQSKLLIIYHIFFALSNIILLKKGVLSNLVPCSDFTVFARLFKSREICYTVSENHRRKGIDGTVWKYFGVFCNVTTVMLGCILGLVIRSRSGKAADRPVPAEEGDMPPREKLPEVMMTCLGFCTVSAAVSGLIGVESGTQALVCVGSMVLGFLIGWALRLDDRINRLGEAALARTGGGDPGRANPAQGVVTACLLFCIGSMTVLGSFESAANPADQLDLNCHTTLLIKSMLDFVSSTCLTVTFGVSVMASAVFVLLFQGALVLLASFIQPFLERTGSLPAMNCVGSLILLAIALNLMDIKKIKTADYLPALFLPILICWILTALGIVI